MANTKITSNVIANNAVGIAALNVSDGSNGQVLSTNGSGTLSFATVSGTTINNNADNRIITGSGTANTLNGEANFVFDGSNVGIGTSTLNKIFNIADPNQGGETLKLHFEAESSADKWAIYSYDRTNGHYADMSFGGNYLYLKSGGNVGIGTTNPVDTLTLAGTTKLLTFDTAADASFSGIRWSKNLAGGGDGTAASITSTNEGNYGRKGIAFSTGNYQDFTTNALERMRIDSSGKTMIGATTPVVSCMLTVKGNYNNERGIGIQSTTSGGDLMMFYATAQVGTITSTGGGTNYNSASDYRLKENVNYDWDATTRLKQLKPARFNWINDEKNTLIDGFLAHEVEDVVSHAVRGTKDDVDENGDVEPQSIDQSKLVPLLVKTIQELEARITTLENA